MNILRYSVLSGVDTIKQPERLGMDCSHARRYLKKRGIKTQKRRTAGSGSQLCLTVTEEQFENVLAQRRDEGFLGSGNTLLYGIYNQRAT